MSAIKCKHEYKTLTEFKYKVSKNSIKQTLRQAELITYRSDGQRVIFTTYDIKVGLFTIRLILNQQDNNIKLKDYGSFQIEILEDQFKVNPIKDYKFKSQDWANKDNIRINDLVNVISHCHRLNELKSFL